MSTRSDLEAAIVATISAERAYNVAGICAGYGLEPANGDDPNKSRRVYVERRVRGLDSAALLALGERVLPDYVDRSDFEGQVHALREAIRMARAGGRLRVTEVTRTHLIAALDALGDLAGEQNLVEFLGRVWHLKNFGSTYGGLEYSIQRHMMDNNDWAIRDLLEMLKLRSCSDELLFEFLAAVVHPLARTADNQRRHIEVLSPILRRDGFVFVEGEPISTHTTYTVVPERRGVAGQAKNLIFGSIAKPDLYLLDAINNDLGMVENPNNPLWYDRVVSPAGLTWGALVEWWATLHSLDPASRAAEEQLFRRLSACVGVNSQPGADSVPEKVLFWAYYGLRKTWGRSLPALLPQVWLHYDPRSMAERHRADQHTIERSRMDFLLLLPHQARVVIEVDGKQHYTDQKGRGSPPLYAAMMKEDRRLRLLRYEVYRFGGAELPPGSEPRVQDFFRQLLALHAE